MTAHARAYNPDAHARCAATVRDMLGKLIIVLFLGVIVYNLGAGLYYMMSDKGGSDRMVKALTRRIALSVLLILLVGFAAWMGWIQPHELGR